MTRFLFWKSLLPPWHPNGMVPLTNLSPRRKPISEYPNSIYGNTVSAMVHLLVGPEVRLLLE
jgi:hypothetical protein